MNQAQPKVLEITSRSDFGGGSRHVFDLLRALQGSEFEAWIASPEDPPFATGYKEQAKRFLPIPARRFTFAAFRLLAKTVLGGKVDLIHSHGRGAGLFSRPLGVLIGRPVLHTFHSVHLAPGIIGRVKLLLDQMLAFLPFTAIFVSEEEQERAEAYKVVRGQNRVVLLSAVDIERFPYHEPRENPRPFRVGIFLRADEVKGPDLFLALASAAARRTEFSGVTFTCAGITREELSRYGALSENVEVRGRLPDPSQWLSGLDLYISTSRVEGLPLAILEALASGKPALISDIPTHGIFRRLGVAQFFDAQNPDNFLAHLLRLMPYEKRLSASRHGRKVMEEQFSLQVFRERLLRLYRESCKGIGHKA